MSTDIANHSNRGLSELIESWIAEEMARSPVRATVLGFDGYDDQLGSFAEEDILAEQRANHTWHDRFEAAAVPAGDDALAIDRGLILSALRGRLVMEDWQAWRRDPSLYLDPGLSGVNTLFLHGTRPLPELVTDAASRLNQVPMMVAAAIDHLDQDLIAPTLRDRAVSQCGAAAHGLHLRWRSPIAAQTSGVSRTSVPRSRR